MKKVILGLSGGVDSAVSAYLLKNQGYEVLGVFMRNWDSLTNNDILGNPNTNATICPEEQDWLDAQEVAKQLGIKIERVDFVKEYWDDVFKDLIENYQDGKTPNPDILCNKYIKFGKLFEWAKKNYPEYEYIATGHYAKIIDGKLYKPKDKWKDQTYFLSQVDYKKWNSVIFPLSDLTKEEVREIAKKENLHVANKKDSVGICFIGERDFAKFLENYIPAQPGNVVDINAQKIVGTHNGAMYYTIGQRKGLKLGGMEEPFYVVGHDLEKRIIYVSSTSNRLFLMSDKSIIKNINWMTNTKDNLNNINVKFRYKSQSVSCDIKWLDEKTIEVIYKDGFEAVTPGQQAVFYQDDLCLGGGVIDQVFYQDEKKWYL